MVSGYTGKRKDRACVYFALHDLLGWKWDNAGRQFCQGIIEEYNGYPCEYLHIIPEFAPVRYWGSLQNVRHSQAERMVIGRYNNQRIRIHANHHVIVVYENTYVHAVCTPAHMIAEIKANAFYGLLTYHPVLIDTWR